ncbi:Os06g0258801 [Oryza sativa Japonica Group]|nr:Os06g0258801 [Oryza sativa Japonica Group]
MTTTKGVALLCAHAQEVNKDEVLMCPAVDEDDEGLCCSSLAPALALGNDKPCMLPILALENINDEGCCGVRGQALCCPRPRSSIVPLSTGEEVERDGEESMRSLL